MSGDGAEPGWLAEAARMPVGFAQVREDGLLDLALLDRIGGRNIRGIMIASGGCTAAALASSGQVVHLHLVDANPAQIALSRVKLHLLVNATPRDRARILGHAESATPRAEELASILKTLGLSGNSLGAPELVGRLGPDHCGRYEMLFAQLRLEMVEFVDELIQVLGLADPIERMARTGSGTALGRAIEGAFERVMALENLVRLFGNQATQNSALPFFRHFTIQTRNAIASMATADNPYLWQVLVGRFPEWTRSPWLEAAPPKRMPEVVTSVARFDDVLGDFQNAFDFVHLSNILDWLSPDETRRMLALARGALRPGGFAFIRQLNSTLELTALEPEFDWLKREADELHRRDRSFFYRRLHLGRKR